MRGRQWAATVALGATVLGITGFAPAAPHHTTASTCKNSRTAPVIDVLVGYTPRARRDAGGVRQIRGDVRRAVRLTNVAFSSSGVRARLRLVHTTAVFVPAEQDRVSQALLRRIATRGDGVADEVHRLRNRHGADLVSVIGGGRAAGGFGYTPKRPSARTANHGFSLVAHSSLKHFSFAHEIGHNLGATHYRVARPEQPTHGANGYFPKNGSFSTLMAYESACRKATKGRCNRINHFANPRQTYRGQPLGKPGVADTASVFNRTSKAIASYRKSKHCPKYRPRASRR